jgi:hypothetical protein
LFVLQDVVHPLQAEFLSFQVGQRDIFVERGRLFDDVQVLDGVLDEVLFGGRVNNADLDAV